MLKGGIILQTNIRLANKNGVILATRWHFGHLNIDYLFYNVLRTC